MREVYILIERNSTPEGWRPVKGFFKIENAKKALAEKRLELLGVQRYTLITLEAED